MLDISIDYKKWFTHNSTSQLFPGLNMPVRPVVKPIAAFILSQV